ncbi:hypothetical protein J6590_087546 [Homalodisca vitripennis]|nr:hypothetical protein J6590_087546 [Homalodisca vitripennis]
MAGTNHIRSSTNLWRCATEIGPWINIIPMIHQWHPADSQNGLSILRRRCVILRAVSAFSSIMQVCVIKTRNKKWRIKLHTAKFEAICFTRKKWDVLRNNLHLQEDRIRWTTKTYYLGILPHPKYRPLSPASTWGKPPAEAPSRC